MADAIAAKPRLAGWRVVSEFAAVAIRHFPGDTSASDAVRQIGLAWSDAPGELIGTDPWLAWRSPQETIAIGLERGQLRSLMERLAPGRSDSAVAMDLSDALGVLELHGSRLDEWLARLVDAMSVPRNPGRCARARMADAAVLLLRLSEDRLWMVLDRPIRAYAENWLAYAREGAFRADQDDGSDVASRCEDVAWRNQHGRQ